jgi:methionyl aminopeptidase
MVNAGSPEVRVLGDGWTAVTRDGRRSAHYEHSVAITEEGPLVLTAPPRDMERGTGVPAPRQQSAERPTAGEVR